MLNILRVCCYYADGCYANFRNTPSTAGNSMTSSERPSPEPIPEKEASPAVLGGREFWKRSGSLKCFELKGLGHPSRTLEGNSRKRSESVSGVFPEFFRNFFRKVPAVLGVWPRICFSRSAGFRLGLRSCAAEHSNSVGILSTSMLCQKVRLNWFTNL